MPIITALDLILYLAFTRAPIRLPINADAVESRDKAQFSGRLHRQMILKKEKRKKEKQKRDF
jgi:hypothetical protein